MRHMMKKQSYEQNNFLAQKRIMTSSGKHKLNILFLN